MVVGVTLKDTSHQEKREGENEKETEAGKKALIMRSARTGSTWRLEGEE